MMASAGSWGTAFLGAVRRIAPDQSFDVVAAAGEAAGLATTVASAGLAKGMVLFQPSPDRPLEEVTATEVPVEELAASASWMIPVIEALHEPDHTGPRDLIIGGWRDRYGPYLATRDLELACQVIGDHAEDLLAVVNNVVVTAEHGEDIPPPGPPWIDRLGEIDVPVTTVVSQPAIRMGQAVAARARDGQALAARAYTDLVWLEDRPTAQSALRQKLDAVAHDQEP